MEKLLKQMEGLVDEDFCDILSGVIDQLMSKELLYDSMKDLSDRVNIKFQYNIKNNSEINILFMYIYIYNYIII